MEKLMTRLIKYLFYYAYLILKSSYNYITYDKYRQKYNLDETFRFNGNGIIFNGNGKILIERNTYIGEFINTICWWNDWNIGDNCAISHNVRIYTSNYETNEIIYENSKTKTKSGNVCIGNNCWIGVNVLITEGVTIGSNVVIGGNSVVTKNIPSNCVVGGVPASY